MSLSRSASPAPGGGWSSPGLNTNGSGRASPAQPSFSGNGDKVTWESARLKTRGVAGYPSFSTQNSGFLSRHMRRISQSLPTFQTGPDRFAEKEKPGRARWNVPLPGRLRGIMARMGRKWKIRMLLAAILLFCYTIFWVTRRSCPRSPRWCGPFD